MCFASQHQQKGLNSIASMIDFSGRHIMRAGHGNAIGHHGNAIGHHGNAIGRIAYRVWQHLLLHCDTNASSGW